MALAHWDEVDPRIVDLGPLGFRRFDLGRAAGSRDLGLARSLVEAGRMSSPVHVHGDEEEIFFVLGGSGLSVQDGKAYEVGAGDCIVHRANAEAHTLVAGDDGLDILAFGQRASPTTTYLPRARTLRFGNVALEVPPGSEPFEREASRGRPDLPEPSPLPETIVRSDELEGEYDGRWKGLARAAGAIRTGLNLVDLRAREEGAPPHLHSADEELFVVLAGSGTLELWPSPVQVARGRERENHPLRGGHVVSRLPGSGIAHCMRAGDEGLRYLVYGTREPNDICYYPRSNKIYWRGVGLIARLEPLDYMNGEPED